MEKSAVPLNLLELSKVYMYLKSMAVSLFMVVVCYCLYCKYRNTNGNIGLQSEQSIPHVTYFPIRIPYVDGLYSIYKIKTYGVKQLEKWSKQYGKVYEIPVGTQSVVVLGDPNMIQKLLASKDPHHLSKPHYYTDKVFMENFTDGVLNSDYNTWVNQRRRSRNSFSYRSQQSFLSYLNAYGKQLDKILIPESSLEEECTIGVDKVWDILDTLVMTLMTHFVTGCGPSSDTNNAKFYQEFHSLKTLATKKLLNPEVYLFWNFSRDKWEYERLRKSIKIRIETIVHRYRSKENVTNDEAEEKEGYSNDYKPFASLVEELVQQGASDKEIQDETGTFLTAGYETVVRAIQMTLVHLGCNKDEQTKCREEVDQLLDSNGNKFDGEDLNMIGLSQLKHLERCIFESLRLTAVVPVFLRRLDSPLKISEDLTLKAGTNVCVMPWVLHRDPEYFPNPTKFDSRRFLTENTKNRHPCAFIPFSSGQRNCIGSKVAIMEIKVVIAHIIRHFEIHIDENLEDVNFLFYTTIIPERNFKITLKKRHQQDQSEHSNPYDEVGITIMR